jgi:hypothetical protein
MAATATMAELELELELPRKLVAAPQEEEEEVRETSFCCRTGRRRSFRTMAECRKAGVPARSATIAMRPP